LLRGHVLNRAEDGSLGRPGGRYGERLRFEGRAGMT
jgi:hypothetical protein